MTSQKITKYYYHEYVICLVFVLSISALIALFFIDFTPTNQVKITAFIVATLIYLAVLIYFYVLHSYGQWIIPRTWTNVQKKPKFYFLLLFPIFVILFLYLNLVVYPPLLHTLVLGTPTVVTLEASAVKKHGKKGSVYYSIETPYDSTGMFRINVDEYEHYKNQNLFIKLSVIEGRFGTYIQDIQSIHGETRANK